jgi:hypothetical protein
MNYEWTEKAKEDLEFDCSECGSQKMPNIAGVRDVNREEDGQQVALFADKRVETECADCGNESHGLVWDEDLAEGE